MSNKELKNSWRKTGIELGHAFRDLGKSLVKTGTTVAKKADRWASDEGQEEPQQAQNTEQSDENKAEQQTESDQQ